MPGKQTIPVEGFPRSIWRWNETGTAWVEVIMPKWAKKVVLTFKTNDGFLSHTTGEGQDFVNAIVDQAEDVPANAKYNVPITEGRSTSQARVFVRVAGATQITAVAEASEVG